MILSDFKGRSNNLQLLKYIAAVLVIVSHSYTICYGTNEREPLYLLTNGQMTLGALAVGIFFCTSGYYVAKSLDRVKCGRSYFKLRCKRIFPPLLVTVIVTIILGAICSSLKAKQYFLSIGTYKYLLNAILIPVHNLPGVFENSPYMPTVNGALWTLPVEFGCYILCFLMWKLGFFEHKKSIIASVLVATVSALCLIMLGNRIPMIYAILRPILLFYVGVLFYINRNYIKLNLVIFALLIAVIIVGSLFGVLNFVFVICFTYIVMYIVSLNHQIHSKMAIGGNWSYGVYLIAFPIQQLLVCNTAVPKNVIANSFVTIVIASIYGYIINKYIEK